MAFKIVLLFASLAAVKAGILEPAGVYHQKNTHTDVIFPQQQPQYYHQAPAVIKSYQPAVVKQIVQPTLVKKIVEHEAPANYEFNYDVHDPHTGDIKQQNEKAVNGAISGQYSLIDADGYRRIVDYTADDHHGFNANVRREPLEGHKVVKTIQPVVAVQKVIAQPAIAVQKYVAAPAAQYYQAPVQKYVAAPAPQYYQAPVQKYYSAPKVTVAQPVVQKYVTPVVQKYVSPVVQKYVAPAPQYYSAPAQVVKAVAQPVKYSTADHSHVTFNGPSSNYHY